MNGGKRAGAGRKSKAEELKLIERLSPMSDDAMKAMHKGVKKGEYAYVKMYFEYYYGKPTDTVNMKHSGEVTTKRKIDLSKLSLTDLEQLERIARRVDSGSATGGDGTTKP